ncbi:uncharacterized protein LOC108041958 [Drosophila rhopaloa]|uniref:Uncharacterized protein LOC108041958 n=1 Tax=Drosophila rhopaloa TaxID=1041015 RepID=A0A6P4EBL1_DRORH|nr:uncharacterized protein LOC108041958 [Drosophila rhopaloa]
MYECSRCGHQRSNLNLRADEQFQSAGEDYIEGASSWCNSCGELTFFIKSHVDTNFVQPLITNSVDSIDSVPFKGSAAFFRGVLHPRTIIQNKQAASLANHLNNWAVEAMDPPKGGGSFTTLPNRHGLFSRNQRSQEEDGPPPPITPLNVISTLSPRSQSDDEKTIRNSSPVRAEKRNPSLARSRKSEQVKGIELLRSTPPSHLSPELPREQDRRLSPVNPYTKTFKNRVKTSQEPATSTKPKFSTDQDAGIPRPGISLKEVKKMKRRYATNDFSGPETSNHSTERTSPGSYPNSSETTSQAPSNVNIQKRLVEKRLQMRRLTSMRSRLEAEFEETQMELADLERRHRRSQSGRSLRESGGAHLTFTRLVHKRQKDEQIEGKRLEKKDKLETLLKTLHEQDLPHFKSWKVEKDQDQDREYLDSHKPTAPPLETETDSGTESDEDLEIESSTKSASSMERESKVKNFRKIYKPLPYQLKHPFANLDTFDFYMPNAHEPKDNFQRSKPLSKTRSIQVLASSAQRASFGGVVHDPLEAVKRINTLEDARKVQQKAPEAHFSTVACEEKEVIRLIKKKPYVTQPEKVKELDISRSPVRCPDSDCRRMSFVSDFNSHLLLDHRSLTMERIKARETKTFFLDTNTTLMDQPKCHMLYMVRDKVFDTKGRELCDLLPVLVMSARTRLRTVLASFGVRSARAIKRKRPGGGKKFFVLWLTGLVPRNIKLMATVSMWSTLGSDLADCVSVNTTHIYDIRAPNEMGPICRSRCSMMVPMSMIKRMTDKGRKFLAIQVQVY